MDEFLRRYRKLKRLQNSIKNNSIIPKTSSGGTKNNQENKYSQNAIVSSYSSNRDNKTQRQEELKDVLKETMSLTTKLKDQLKILEKNGVCGTKPMNFF